MSSIYSNIGLQRISKINTESYLCHHLNCVEAIINIVSIDVN